MKKKLFFIITIISISATYAQVGINADNSAPLPSAQLDVKSTTKAFYPPRMTTVEKDAIVGKQAGAVVFDNTLNQLSFYNGTSWVASSGGSGFNLPYLGSAAAGNGGYVLDIANTTGSDGSAIVGRNSTQITGEGVLGVANAISPLSSVAGVYGRSASTNSNGVGVKAFHAGTGAAFLGSTTDGVGASLISTNGFALKTQGKLQIAGNGVGTLGIGKFLKSTSSNGDAQWADLPAPSSLVLPFSQTANSSLSLFQIQNDGTGFGISGISNTNIGIRGQTVSGIAINGEATGTGTAANFVSVSEPTVKIKLTATTPTIAKNALEVTNNSENDLGIAIKGIHQSGGTAVMGETQAGTGVLGKGYDGVKGEGYYGVHGIGSQRGVFGEKSGTTGSAIHGVGGLYAVYGQSDAYGVYGVSNFLEPNQYKYAGVYGESNSNNNLGSGVYGNHNGLGPGVSGNSFYGIGGRFNSDNGYALVTQSGNVGIGTNTPAAKMDIQGASYASHFFYSANEDTYIRGGKAGSRVLINDIDGQGNVGIGVSDPAYILDVKDRIRLRANGANTAGLYLNNAANTTWAAFHGMKTDTQSGIFIGGTWRFWVDNTGAGFLNGNLIQTSDKRLKKDFNQLNNSLTDIYKLNGYHFRWLEEARNKDLQTGLIAQEVQKIFPELVQRDENGFLSVNYIGLIPHLIEAVKELKNENELLKTNNKTVESRLEKLEQMLNFSAKKQ